MQELGNSVIGTVAKPKTSKRMKVVNQKNHTKNRLILKMFMFFFVCFGTLQLETNITNSLFTKINQLNILDKTKKKQGPRRHKPWPIQKNTCLSRKLQTVKAVE